MHRKWIMIVAALLAAWPATLAAQGTPRPQRAPRAARPPNAARAWAFAMSDNRGRIGVIPKTEADPETDKFGAKIEGVTPGGPAAKAGLKVGDIITKFNNTSLAGLKAEDEEESGPSSKLVELAHKLEPGDTVQIEYRRGNDTKKATLVAEDLGSSFRVEIPNMTEPHTMIMPRMPGMNNFEFFGSPWGDLDLVNLNSDLGEYFGAKEGILVVKAPADSSLPLKGGDVILKIGDRTPASPSHAMRILHSYEPGESVSIEVMRRQKRTTITWKVPEARERRFLRQRHAPEDQTELRQRVRTRVKLERV